MAAILNLPCWIQTLPSWIQTPCYLLSDSLKNTLTPLWLWLTLIQSDSNLFILTYLDDGSHLEFCHLEFGHLGFNPLSLSSQSHSGLAKIGSHHLPPKNLTHTSLSTNCTKKLHSFILTQCDDGSHLEFCHHGFSHFAQKNFTHSFWLNLMMAAILNSTMLDSDTAILDSDTLLTSLRFTQKHSHSTLTLTHTNSIWLKLIYSHLNLMMAAILNSAIFNSAILDSTILVFPLKLTHTCPPLVTIICTKKNFTQSFWSNLMMVAILNSAIFDPNTLLSSLRITQKHSHSTLTLTQTKSIWFKLIYSHLTWWWQPSWIWPTWIQPS